MQIGTWSSWFDEGARIVLHVDSSQIYKETVLPLKASGHGNNEEVDNQPTTWENLEVIGSEQAYPLIKASLEKNPI